MAVLKALWPRRGPALYGPAASWWNTSAAISTSSPPMSTDTAMKLSAVWRCAAILSGSVASLPFPIYKRRPGGDNGKDRWPQHPIYDLLHDKPNRWQTAFEWRELGMYALLFRGNFYNWIRPGPRGKVDELWPIDPDRVTPEQQDDGSLTYRVRRADGKEIAFPDDEIFHVRGPSRDGGVTGMGVLDVAADAFRAGLTQEQFAARFFTQSPQPGGLLSHPGRLSPEAQNNLRNSWVESTSGAKAHRPAILEEGLTYTPFSIGLTAEQTQLVASRQFTVTDIARWFGVPPHMIGETTKETSWGSGIEQMSIGFVTYTLMPWLRRFETRVNTDLIIASEVYFAEFLIDGLLRGDAKTRAEALAVQRQWGILSTNEWRAIENRNPLEGGDDYLVPLNMAARDADGNPIVPEPAPMPETEAPEGEPMMEPDMEPGAGARSPNGRTAMPAGAGTGRA